MTTVYVCAVGLKGAVFLEGLLGRHVCVDKVFSYPQDGDASYGYQTIERSCARHNISFVQARRPTLNDFAGADLIFLAGWQYLFSFHDSRIVVFHDSLLPRYRGFAPTVTALIAGDSAVGVTALTPDSGVDTGPILAQAQIQLPRPARIGEVLTSQAQVMVDLALKIIQQRGAGVLVAQAQNESDASYAIWRGAEDYFINWQWPSETIERFVYAVGYPYEGAHTCLGETLLIIDECRSVGDLHFPIREPGKVWSMNGDGPSVICGSGLLQLTSMRRGDGSTFRLDKLRCQFDTPSLGERRRLLLNKSAPRAGTL
jgi:methionyl-tRNA formyltransferase